MDLMYSFHLLAGLALGTFAGYLIWGFPPRRPAHIKEITVESNFQEMAEIYMEAQREGIPIVEIQFLGGDRPFSLICCATNQRFGSLKTNDFN